MKLAKSLNPRRYFTKDRKGVALITVLTVLSLTTILVLTFFSLATSEHRSSNTYSQGLQAEQVAQQAVNLVIAQIREATTVGTKKAWASQPGAIRQWDDSGNEDFAYKLYSHSEMKTKDWSSFEKDFRTLDNWSNKPEHYVDLNEPVIRGKKVYYPIIHPLASTEPKWPQALGDDDSGVEGFSYNKTTGRMLADPGPIGQKAARIAGSPDGHVAMPVQWIYQLADGTMGVLGDAAGGGGLESYDFMPISGSGTPSDKNPIVARFAFWADDETSKLNINTHAGGLAWDIPKTGGEVDMAMGKFQPAQHEWQRYPGHPASTHLIPALAPGVLDIVNDRDAMEMLFRLVPRVVGGGSESGTRLIDTRLEAEANGLIPDKEPLFPTIDDIIMRSDREPHEFPDPKGRPIPADELSDYLERAKFFITANSRAPETNMFNQPRVAIWPIYNAAYDSPDYQVKLSPFDRLLHYCASMGKSTDSNYPRNEYVFKREDADSTTHDYQNIQRNKEIYGYLKSLLEKKVPGYGGVFSSKYPASEYQQILTEIFDYIRSTNLHDDTLFTNFEDAFTKDNVNTNPTYTNPRQKDNPQIGHKGHGQVVPIRIDNTKGFGRFYTLGGVQVHVISCAEGANPGEDLPFPRNFGARAYKASKIIDVSNQYLYSNFPPHPAGFEKPSDPENPPPAYTTYAPAWLEYLREHHREQWHLAFREDHWNWQLAYLDEQYLTNVLNDPTASKFNRNALEMSYFQSGATRLGPTEQLVQGALLFSLFTPSVGWSSINPDMEIEVAIQNGSFKFATADATTGEFLGFMQNGGKWVFATNAVDTSWGGRRYGGLMPAEYLVSTTAGFAREIRNLILANGGVNLSTPQNYASGYNFDVQGGRGRVTPLDRGYNLLDKVSGLDSQSAQAYKYDLVTIPFKVDGAGRDAQSRFVPGEIKFTGGNLKFSFYHGGRQAEKSAPTKSLAQYGVSGGELIQEITVEVPNFEFRGAENGNVGYHPALWDRNNGVRDGAYHTHLGGYYNEFDDLAKDSFSLLERNSFGLDPGNPHVIGEGSTANRNSDTRLTPSETKPKFKATAVPSGRFGHLAVHNRARLISPNDIVQTIDVNHGDMRIVAGRSKIVPSDKIFEKHRRYANAPMAHSLTSAVGTPYRGAVIEKDYLILPDLPGNKPYGGDTAIPLPFGVERSRDVQLYGDFDNGNGLMIDGPYINKPDEGNVHSLKGKYMKEITDEWEGRRNYGEFPYFNNPEKQESGGPAYFSPNRLVSGPGMFGSLSTGVMRNEPWRTLLFRPEVKGGTAAGFRRHPGGENPPDHLFMDLFWMPIVEPYAISEPLSTAGKVNLNFDIVPFLHVQRGTALRGIFRSEMMVCLPNEWHTNYKYNWGYGRGRGYHWRDNPYGGAMQNRRFRSVIQEDRTLDEFVKRFDNGKKAFKSATEICEMHLIPVEVSEREGKGAKGTINSYTPTAEQMDSGKYWSDHSLVGDNSRERPYTNIQNRITTKSNTFLVHYRAQVLKQARRDSPSEYAQWRPEVDTVQAEYRGSSLVERYVNPDDVEIPDFAKRPEESLDAFYRYRVVNPRRFAP